MPFFNRLFNEFSSYFANIRIPLFAKQLKLILKIFRQCDHNSLGCGVLNIHDEKLTKNAEVINMNLTKNFNIDEFRCKCGCNQVVMSPRFMYMLQKMRDYFGKKIKISSGFRCNNWNMKVGGAEKSRHLTGDAADCSVVTSDDRFMMVKSAIEAGFKGIGVDGSFIHVDSRKGKARLWLY